MVPNWVPYFLFIQWVSISMVHGARLLCVFLTLPLTLAPSPRRNLKPAPCAALSQVFSRTISQINASLTRARQRPPFPKLVQHGPDSESRRFPSFSAWKILICRSTPLVDYDINIQYISCKVSLRLPPAELYNQVCFGIPQVAAHPVSQCCITLAVLLISHLFFTTALVFTPSHTRKQLGSGR
jgi:hypothetical protein